MLQALYRRSLRRHVPAVSVPGRSALRRSGELVRSAARAALYVAVALGVVLAASLAAVGVVAFADGLALLAWFIPVLAAAAAPGVAARVVLPTSARR